MSNWFKRLPGSRREAPGLEWRLLRRLPALALVGSLLPAIYALGVRVFDADAVDEAAAASGLGPRWADLQADWQAEVGAVLAEAGLVPPALATYRSTGKRGVHSEHMGYILAEMQYLQRAYPGGAW